MPIKSCRRIGQASNVINLMHVLRGRARGGEGRRSVLCASTGLEAAKR